MEVLPFLGFLTILLEATGSILKEYATMQCSQVLMEPVLALPHLLPSPKPGVLYLLTGLAQMFFSLFNASRYQSLSDDISPTQTPKGAPPR